MDTVADAIVANALPTYLMADIWYIIYGNLIQSYSFNTIHALKHTCRDIYRASFRLFKPDDNMYVVEENDCWNDTQDWAGTGILHLEHNIRCTYGDSTMILAICAYNREKTPLHITCTIFVDLMICYTIRVDCANNRDPMNNVMIYQGSFTLLCVADLIAIRRMRAIVPLHARAIEYMWDLITQHKYVQEFAPFVV